MKRLTCFIAWIILLMLISIPVLAGGCTSTQTQNDSPQKVIKGELTAIKFQGSSYWDEAKYWLFVDGQAIPLKVFTPHIEFIYDSKIINPKVEAIAGNANNFKAKVWFRDKEQFREYLR